MYKNFISLIIIILCLACNSDENGSSATETSTTILKPIGIFTSSAGNVAALDHKQVNGSLIRVTWKDIEPNKGNYNFTKIEQFLAPIKSRKLKWSLGIIAGGDSPDWLIDDLGTSYFEIIGIDNSTKRIPKIWDSKVNNRLSLLAEALAKKYNSDTDLVLVYIPQMTANGIEGHFNGVTITQLTNAGLTATNWVQGVKETAVIFANAFSNKALAVEVHDIMGDTSIPTQIMNDLWEDVTLNHRVGAAMWWISGRTSYQPNLVTALKTFPGDIYAQAIGRSDQTERFENKDYKTMFSQAKSIGIRYIELWEYEFVNNTFPNDFEEFNNYAKVHFE